MLNGLPLAQDLEVVRCQRGSAVVAPRVPQSVARASAPEAGKSSLGLQIEAVISGFAGVIRRNPELAGKTEQIGANDLSRPGRVHAKPRIQIEAHPVAAAVAHVIHAERHRLSDLALVAERYLRRSRHLSSGMIVLHRAGVSRQRAGRKHLVEQCAIHGRPFTSIGSVGRRPWLGPGSAVLVGMVSVGMSLLPFRWRRWRFTRSRHHSGRCRQSF